MDVLIEKAGRSTRPDGRKISLVTTCNYRCTRGKIGDIINVQIIDTGTNSLIGIREMNSASNGII